MNGAINAPFVDALSNALCQRQTIALTTASDGSLQVSRLGILDRVWHCFDSKFHEERVSTLAGTLAKILSVQDRLSIPEAAKNRPLIAARNLIKDALCRKVNTEALSSLHKEVIAAKLGITSSVLDHNPGLQKFTETYHLERYLLIYQDSLQVDQETQQVFIRKKGEYQPWCLIAESLKAKVQSENSPAQPWIYGKNGLKQKDMYDWTDLKPYMKGNPAEWGNQYVFEFCACKNPQSVKSGNHTWIRLKTPTGDIYSVGLYRPGKSDWTDNLHFPLRIKPGYLMQPDVSEFWDYPITAVNFAITEEAFLKIKATVEEDKKNEDQVFHLFSNNCMLYCKKLSRMAGVDFPTKDTILNYIGLPSIISNTASAFFNQLPAFVQKISRYAAAVILNFSQMFLGACRLDEGLNIHQKKYAVPHLSSFWDLFDLEKMYLHHPNMLGDSVHKNVMEWRKKELEALSCLECDDEQRKIKENAILFGLPPAYILT